MVKYFLFPFSEYDQFAVDYTLWGPLGTQEIWAKSYNQMSR